MNETTDLVAADRYFADHPQARRWREELSGNARAGALRIAEADILSVLGSEALPAHAPVRHAWFEQALYLLSRPEGPDDGRVIAESIDGVGARTYSGKPHLLAPRAEQLLAPYLGSMTVTLRRG